MQKREDVPWCAKASFAVSLLALYVIGAGGGFSGLFSSLSLISTLHDAASMRVSKNYLKARSRVVALASVE